MVTRAGNRVGARGPPLLPGGGVSSGWGENVLEQSVEMAAPHRVGVLEAAECYAVEWRVL